MTTRPSDDSALRSYRLSVIAIAIEHLDLDDKEISLLREISVNIDNLALWGLRNERRRDEVDALFTKCKELMNA